MLQAVSIRRTGQTNRLALPQRGKGPSKEANARFRDANEMVKLLKERLRIVKDRTAEPISAACHAGGKDGVLLDAEVRRSTVKRDTRAAMDRTKEAWRCRIEDRIHLTLRGTKSGASIGLEIAMDHTEGQEREFVNVLTGGRLRLIGDCMGRIHVLIGGSSVVSDMDFAA